MARKVMILGECEHCGTGFKFAQDPKERSFVTEDPIEIRRCIRCGRPVIHIKNSRVVKCEAGCPAFFVKNPRISQNGQGKVLSGRLEIYPNPKAIKGFRCPVCGEPLPNGFKVKRVKI